MANILPDYILPFAVTVLSHSNIVLEDRTNIDELKIVEKCLNFILEPLINNKDTFCFSLYKNMIEKMKQAKSAYQPMNAAVNEVRFVSSHFLATTKYVRNCIFRKSGRYVICPFISF